MVSSLGQGTRFEILLPCTYRQVDVTATFAAASVGPQGQTLSGEAEFLGKGGGLPFSQRRQPLLPLTDIAPAARRSAETHHQWVAYLTRAPGPNLAGIWLGRQAIDIDGLYRLLRTSATRRTTSNSTRRQSKRISGVGDRLRQIGELIERGCLELETISMSLQAA